MKKRLISLLLSVAVLTTSIPVSAFADNAVGQDPTVSSEESQERGIDYKKNGGVFASGYEAPSQYPASSLPGAEDTTKPGYEFGGWYDNAEFTGEAVTGLDTEKYSGNVVLYARWIDRYYQVDIPSEVSVDQDSFSVTAKAGGFYEDDQVNVAVHSENDWKLKSGKHEVSYALRDKDMNKIVENDEVITRLNADTNQTSREFATELKEKANYTGDYSDQLNFDISFQETEYTIQYVTDGGKVYGDNPDRPGESMEIEQQTLPAGTTLDDLPLAVRKSSTFVGWCYDQECTDYVDSEDRLLGDLTLYASYTDTQPMESVTMDTYARAYDVATDFAIGITNTGDPLDDAAILAACEIKNVSDPSEEVTLAVTQRGDNTCTISNPNGWQPGASYKLTLKKDQLYFTGFDKTIREYDFTVYREETRNVELNREIRYIHTRDLGNLMVNGKAADSVSVAVMTVGADGEIKGEGSDTTGSFTYTKDTLKTGDIIGVYSGDVIPSMDLSAGENSDVSYFEITGCKGTQYEYRGAKAEDVLFTPDVFPLDKKKDQDGDPDNHSVTVAISELTFGDDEMSQALNLDSSTTVDQGDYLALYTDLNSGNPDYGEITKVERNSSDYILEYQPVSLEEMQAAMDVYQKDQVEGDDLLEETDRENLEEQITTQAIDSGFAQDVADRIGAAAIATDSFEELEASLEEELGADVSVEYSTGSQSDSTGTEDALIGQSAVQSMQDGLIPQSRAKKPGQGTGSSKPVVTVSLGTVRANLGTRLKHFDGDVSGVHLALEIPVLVNIALGTGANIQITVTSTFEQEVRVDINVDGKAVWKVWKIFPYIADYKVTASLDLYEYTGIGLDVNFKTVEGEGGSDKGSKLRNGANKIAGELKSMMENGEEYITDKTKFSGSFGDEEEGEEISVSKSLAQRYAELLEEEGDWVEIYNRLLVNNHFRVLAIIDIEVKVEFVVYANINISIGMTYWYKNAKRYVFCLRVMDRTATSDTIDLCEEQYELTAYAMGTLGLKAGVRLTVSVGLLSTKLASVGITAEVGGYAQLWGYLYYELKYTASNGRTTRAMGAMYLELGIYLEIKFLAQALANSFTYNPTLYENQWPLYTVGHLENVLEFAYAQADVKDIKMKRDVKAAELSDDFFRMQYMDMKEGLDDGKYWEKIYDDSTKYFSIVMTNPAFSYDRDTNIITVDPGSEPEQDGEMIITWKNQEGTFNTQPLTRKIRLHWDNLRDGYYIAFDSMGGSYVDTIIGKYNSDIEKPEDPVRAGYRFAGWYEDEELTKPYTIPAKMPNKERTVYAKWEAEDVGYRVAEYMEGTNGIYEAQDTISYPGQTDTEVTPKPREHTGFVTPEEKTETVRADGTTVVKYYYQRAEYTLTFLMEENGEVISEKLYRYGTFLTAPAVYKPGYEFEGWTPEVPDSVPAGDTTYTANWKALDGISYQVEYYVEEPEEDGYTLSEIKTMSGTTGETVTAPEGDYSTAIYHRKGELASGVVKADGTLVLKVYYDLNRYTLTYDPKGGTLDETTLTARPGERIAVAVPEREGYTFDGWYLDEEYQQLFGETMPENDLTVYAKWEEQKVNYTVKHYQEKNWKITGWEEGTQEREFDEKNYELKEEETFSAYAGELVSPAVKSYTGFRTPEKQTVEVQGDGSLVVKYYYARKTGTLLLEMTGEPGAKEFGRIYAVPYGTAIADIDEVVVRQNERAGYVFEGWYTDSEHTNRFDGIMPEVADVPEEPEGPEDEGFAIYGKWTPIPSTYRVEHYQQNPSDPGTYTLVEEETKTALTDTEVKTEAKSYPGFKMPDSQDVWVTGYDVACVQYYYNRNSYPVTYVKNNGEADQTADIMYGAVIDEVPAYSGHAFAGWYEDAALTVPFEGKTMPMHALTLYAKWEAGKKTYQVIHQQQSADGSDTWETVETETFTGTAGDTVETEPKTYDGFRTPEKQSFTLTVSDDPDTIIYQYRRNSYQVTMVPGNGEAAEKVTYLYGRHVEEKPERAGYSFVGWYQEESLTNAFDGTVPAKDITIYAKWEPAPTYYWVKYSLQNANDDGYTVAAMESPLGKTEDVVTPEVREFSGFVSPQAQTGKIEGGKALVIEYRYERKVHTLQLENYDGTASRQVQVRQGATIPVPAERKGYTFTGWYTDRSLQNAYTGNMPDQDLTLYAGWEANTKTYLVKHYLEKAEGDGYRQVATQALNGKTDETVTPPVNTTYGDEYVVPDPQTVTISGEEITVVNYYYKRKVHKLTFITGENEQPQIVEGRVGASLHVENPQRVGYTFEKWDPQLPATIPNQDVTYKAVWKENTYTVEFVDDETTLQTEQLTQGASIKKPADPVKEGYEFAGWDKAIPDKVSEETVKNGTLTLHAVWKEREYRITYDLGGGELPDGKTNPDKVTITSSPEELTNPKREGYTFMGWSGTDITDKEKNVTITARPLKARSYTANWKQNSYQIIFRTNGAVTGGKVNNITTLYENEVTLPENGYTCPGYKFVGWSLEKTVKEGTKVYKAGERVSKLCSSENGTCSLYAIWEPTEYTVHFAYETGTRQVTCKYNEMFDLPAVSRYGWTFKGWSNQKGSKAAIYTADKKQARFNETQDLYLYAIWEPNRSYTYQASSGFKHRITDSHKEKDLTKYTFYVQGNQTNVETTADNGLKPAHYNLNMTGLSYDAANTFSKMKIEVTYTIQRKDNGWADLKLSYSTRSGGYSKDASKTVFDLKDCKNKTVTHTFEYSHKNLDMDYFTLVFDAHGHGDDDYDMSNLKVKVTFE